MNKERKHYKAWIIFWCLFTLAIIIVIPFILEYCVFRRDRYSVIDNSDWASFLGGYIGAIVGAIGIGAALMFSRLENNRIINANRDENNRFIRGEIRPYFKYLDKILHEEDINSMHSNHYLIYGEEKKFLKYVSQS